MASPNSQTTTVYGFGAGGPAEIGQSASTLVAFHGAAGTVQSSFVAQIGTTFLEASVSVSAIVGFSSGRFSLMIGLINSMQAVLVNKGLMAAS